MEEKNEIKSLLSDTSEEVVFPESLLNSLDTTSEAVDKRQEKINELVEERKTFFMDPENQAEILLQNYLMSNNGMYLTGKQKRNLRREFLRNAKKGKYNKMFEREAYNIPSDETLDAFKSIND